jgi:UDP-N-acetylglucosamine--N-acetylmuramyl-(pentapeptide) pyrophosphoryl-undecaprenol N-acetylglucosamine transferase
MINIAFTGGGTGGHIYPGLAVAAELKKLMTGSEFRLFWIGSSTGMDRSLVEDAGIEFFGIPSGKLRRYFALRTIVDFFKVVGGFFAARKILKKQMRLKKDKNNKGTKGFLNKTILFSKGGYVSVPPCAAAASLGIPVFTHESDYSPGLATKINARFVSAKGRIFTAYEETKKFFPEKIRERITVSGNPVRSAFRSADPKKGRTFLQVTDNERILLVLGGSQGAHEINELIRKSLDRLTETYTVVHQTGPNL